MFGIEQKVDTAAPHPQSQIVFVGGYNEAKLERLCHQGIKEIRILLRTLADNIKSQILGSNETTSWNKIEISLFTM